MNNQRLGALAVALCLAAGTAQAQGPGKVRSPAPGVLCDAYVCANAGGLSRALTAKYLGPQAAAQPVFTQAGVNLGAFTLANGVFCDVKERLCRTDRYFGPDGKHSGAVSKRYTRLLFGE